MYGCCTTPLMSRRCYGPGAMPSASHWGPAGTAFPHSRGTYRLDSCCGAVRLPICRRATADGLHVESDVPCGCKGMCRFARVYTLQGKILIHLPISRCHCKPRYLEPLLPFPRVTFACPKLHVFDPKSPAKSPAAPGPFMQHPLPTILFRLPLPRPSSGTILAPLSLPYLRRQGTRRVSGATPSCTSASPSTTAPQSP